MPENCLKRAWGQNLVRERLGAWRRRVSGNQGEAQHHFAILLSAGILNGDIGTVLRILAQATHIACSSQQRCIGHRRIGQARPGLRGRL